MLSPLDYDTIDLIEREYQSTQLPWSLGFSGGKDSSALLKLVFNALENIKNPSKPVNVIYCDTGVEIPIISEFVKSTFLKIATEIKELNLPINLKIVEPRLEHKFFSKVIGRGYPTPTNKFRWCTDKLRVTPIQALIDNNIENIVLVGVRKGESIERDKIMRNNVTDNPYYFNQVNFPKVKIFAPIRDYNVEDIWSILRSKQNPRSLNGLELELIYKKAGDDQIDFKDSTSKSLQKGRFGCWTCTVVRKDKAVKNLISNGCTSLIPLWDFRNWIYEIRDNPYYRCKHRRNGQNGLGPFTIEARKLILDKLLTTQLLSGYNLISDNEIEYIKKLWDFDVKDINYHE